MDHPGHVFGNRYRLDVTAKPSSLTGSCGIAGDASWNARAAFRRLEVDDPGCLIELRCGGQPTNRSQITAVAALYLNSRDCALQQTPATPPTGRGNAIANQRPTIARTSAFRNRSTTSMNPIDGTSSRSAVMEAIW